MQTWTHLPTYTYAHRCRTVPTYVHICPFTASHICTPALSHTYTYIPALPHALTCVHTCIPILTCPQEHTLTHMHNVNYSTLIFHIFNTCSFLVTGSATASLSPWPASSGADLSWPRFRQKPVHLPSRKATCVCQSLEHTEEAQAAISPQSRFTAGNSPVNESVITLESSHDREQYAHTCEKRLIWLRYV